ELDILLGSVGNPGEDIRGVATPGLGWRLHYLGPHRGRSRIGAPEGWKILCHRREFIVPGQLAHPQPERGGSKKTKRAFSGRADDRRVDRGSGPRSRAESCRLDD